MKGNRDESCMRKQIVLVPKGGCGGGGGDAMTTEGSLFGL